MMRLSKTQLVALNVLRRRRTVMAYRDWAIAVERLGRRMTYPTYVRLAHLKLVITAEMPGVNVMITPLGQDELLEQRMRDQ